MKTIRHTSLGRLTLFLALILFSRSVVPSEALALSPTDLVIVYNLTIPESEAVASYYAKKRGVPRSHLVGVDVPTTERVLWSDFQQRLLPPVLAAAKRLKDEGRDPAILLVYGIPLGIRGPVDMKPEKAFVALAGEKVGEYMDLVLRMIGELDNLRGERDAGASKPTHSATAQSPKDVLKRAGESVISGFRYLREVSTTKENRMKTRRISSLLMRLVGTSHAEKVLLGKMSKEEREDRKLVQSQELLKWNAILKGELLERSFWGILPEQALEIATAVRFVDGILGELKLWYELKRMYEDDDISASVDSELTLMVAGPYQRVRCLPNPFHAKYDRLPFIENIRGKTIMVGRLDGPTPEAAKRLVDDAVATEKVGLRGIFYIDARGLTNKDGTDDIYSLYDRHLFNLYDVLKESSSMEVVIDKGVELFAVGACPNAALYCGWYSLGNYVDSFTWQKGSIGFHVASAEASTLREKDSSVWCKRMIEEGICATLGPVEEPYLSSFPLPDHFFPLLMAGKVPLLEVYFRTLPFISWRQILIGDPLYMPFKKSPAIHFPESTAKPKGAEMTTPTDYE